MGDKQSRRTEEAEGRQKEGGPRPGGRRPGTLGTKASRFPFLVRTRGEQQANNKHGAEVCWCCGAVVLVCKIQYMDRSTWADMGGY